MEKNKNYYEILGVSEDATLKEIKDKYKSLQMKWDPKKNPGKKEGKKWHDIKTAYETLSNKEKRTEYDKQLNEIIEGEIVEEKKEENKEKEVEPELKAYFFPRVVAYIIDAFLISAVASFIFAFFPQVNNLLKLNEEQVAIQESFLQQEITQEQYLAQSLDLSYDMAYQNVVYVLIEVSLALGYFVVFQYKNGGRTLGKKLMHIKVVSATGEELTVNSFLYRALLLQSLAIDVLLIGGVFLLKGQAYGAYELGFSLFQTIFVLTTLGMVLFRKDGRGLHDLLGGTKVVMDGSKERELCVN